MNNASWPPLWWAVENLDLDCARALLQSGASANEPFPDSKATLLHLAVNAEAAAISNGDDVGIEMTKLLRESGGDLRAVDADGRTPLDLARKCRHLEAARFLEHEM
jgi:ankyrin repeat protein